MHHLGGMFPYFAGRIETILKGDCRKSCPDPSPNTGGTSTGYRTGWKRCILSCGYAFFGPDRMLFGTDYPYGAEEGEHFIKANLNGVRAMNIPAADMEKILGGNAKKLFKIL